MKRELLIAALALAAMAGCAKDETGGAESYAASFSSSIDQTRVSGTEWESGDQIGVMVTTNNDLLSSYRYNNCHNVSFADPEHGIFTPATVLDQIYYALDESYYLDFYAYYPYNEALSAADQSYPIDVSDQSVPKDLDFMEASTRSDSSEGYNKNSGVVPLDFSRNMAKITLKIVAGSGMSLDGISSVRLQGFYTKATYDFPTNSFTELRGNSSYFTPYKQSSGVYTAILIPHNASWHRVYFTTSYGEIVLNLSDYSLARGEHLYFTVTVSQTAATCEQSTINGWGDAEIEDDTFETK